MPNPAIITRGLIVSVVGVLLAVALGAFVGLSRPMAMAMAQPGGEAASEKPAAPALPTQPPVRSPDVRLVIDFQDGTQLVFPRVSLIDIHRERTVLDALQLATKIASPRALTFDATGSGEMTLVTAIAGVKNEGGGKEARNWQFWVNDQFATRGVGATVIQPGDRITWAFMPWNESGPPKRPE